MEIVKAKTLINYDPFVVWLIEKENELKISIQLYNRAIDLLRIEVDGETLYIELPQIIFRKLAKLLEGKGFTNNADCGAVWILRGKSLKFVGGVKQWNVYVDIRPGDDDGNIE